MRQSTILLVIVGIWTSAKGSEVSNDIAAIGASSVLIDDGGCANLCDDTDACINDPHHHGSYCKFWQSPPVCFGMVSSVFF
jgi:hypothetical protein